MARPRYCSSRMTLPPRHECNGANPRRVFCAALMPAHSRGGGGSRLVRRFRFHSGPSLRASGSHRAPERARFPRWLCRLPGARRGPGGDREVGCAWKRENERPAWKLGKTLLAHEDRRTGEDEPHGDIRKGPRPTRPGDGKGGPGKRKAVVGMESWRGRL